jgi:hypothetical protein
MHTFILDSFRLLDSHNSALDFTTTLPEVTNVGYIELQPIFLINFYIFHSHFILGDTVEPQSLPSIAQ